MPYFLVSASIFPNVCDPIRSNLRSRGIDLLLNKIRVRYEKEWELLDAEECEGNRTSSIEQDETNKEREIG